MELIKGTKYKVKYIIYKATFSGSFIADEITRELIYDKEDINRYYFTSPNTRILKTLIINIEESR